MTPQDWLKGTKWDGMPYHVTLGHPGWDTTEQQVEVRSCVFSFFVLVGLFLFFFAGPCCRDLWSPLPHNIAEVEPGACLHFLFHFFFAPCLRMRVYVCVLCW